MRKILTLAVLTFSCFNLLSVPGYAQTKEDLSAPTLRQIPDDAKEIDVASVPTFTGRYVDKVSRFSQNFSFGKEPKKIGWWTSGCGQISYAAEKAFETANFWYLKSVLVTKLYGQCTPTSYVNMIEVSKNGKDGFYSSSTREGTFKMD